MCVPASVAFLDKAQFSGILAAGATPMGEARCDPGKESSAGRDAGAAQAVPSCGDEGVAG
jgi:hypothetical protein